MNRTAIVTGASSGIGLATARLLYSRGYEVVLVARSEDALQRVADELGDRAYARPCDVGDIDALPGLVDDCVARFGDIDVLVNNAGAHYRGSMMRHTYKDLAQMIEVNTAAPIALTRLVVDHMPRGGVIVNVASLAGKLPVPGSATYSGSKAGVRFWALAAAEDLEPLGIRVVNVNPGPVDTGFFAEDLENVAPLTFSQPMSTAEQVAEGVWKGIESDASPLEIDIPGMSGKLATLGYVSPRMRALLRPGLEKRGQRVKEELQRRQGS